MARLKARRMRPGRTLIRAAAGVALAFGAASLGHAQQVAQPAPVAQAATVEPIPEPQGDVEKAALAALDKHCARCHQAGDRLKRLKPAKNFGNVLFLKQMSQDPNLVLPGNPDGSKLFKLILNREMPYDLYQEGDLDQPSPSKEEVLAIRTWIEQLGKATAAACANRTFLDSDAMTQAIADDLGKLKDNRVKGTRYLTLTNLYNACAGDEEMEVYRQAVVKLLNSLSRNSDVLRLETVGNSKAILRLHLDDLKWTAADWENILKVYPYATKTTQKTADFVAKATGTKLPHVRGDWFVFTAARPPLYHDLLKLPKTAQELEKQLGVDVKANLQKFLARRAGFQKSLVSQNNRLIERHTISTGVYWTSYDFGGNKGRQSLFEHPTGPGGEAGFTHDGGETIFNLPNGFQAYYLSTAKGARIDKGPTEIVRDLDRKDLAVTNGISCMGCHDQGIRKATDEVRKHVLDNRSFSRPIRDQVAALHPTSDVMDKLLAEDGERFRTAEAKAGIDPALKLNGVEIINALSNRYEKDIDLRLAAAEFGLKEEEFKNAMLGVGGKAVALLRRLEQGSVPRDNLEFEFRGLVGKVNDEELVEVAAGAPAAPAPVAKVNQGDAAVAGAFQLSLFADKSAYQVNDLPVLTVQSSKDCHLTLVNVTTKGDSDVIFPNKFQQENRIAAGKPFLFPAPEAKFQFRFQDPGFETVIAVCNAVGRSVDTIKPDFNKPEVFTKLGNYRAFLARKIEVEAKEAKPAPKPPAKAQPGVAVASGIARTAIKIPVN